MFNVVLLNPQIPPNTGNIGRLCVNANAKLHLIKPIGFDLSEKSLRRAGLDYWHLLDLHVWEDAETFFDTVSLNSCYFCTTKTTKNYFDVNFKPNDYIILGSETSGIPMEIMQRKPEHMITIPMGKNGRSLNLSVSTGIVLYEAIRQNFGVFYDS